MKIRQDIKSAFPAGMTEIAALRLANAFRKSVSLSLTPAGLEIKVAGSALAKAGATVYALANSKLVTKATGTDMAALSGTVTADAFNVYCFFVDSSGTLTTKMGTEGTTLASVQFPEFDPAKACLGFVIINPTGTGNFVGGTTDLDDATVVPNAVFIDTPFHFEPKANLTLEN